MAQRDPKNGHFLPGNQFWKARSSHGRNPKYADPETLRDAIEQYFDWNDANPLYKDQLVTFQGSATHEPVAQMRAMTVAAMCMFIDINHSTWIEWRTSRPDLSTVMAWAESVIYRQKFEGAAADLLSPNIIARDLGLADKRDLSSTDGTMTPRPGVSLTMTPEQAAEAYAASIEP